MVAEAEGEVSNLREIRIHHFNREGNKLNNIILVGGD